MARDKAPALCSIAGCLRPLHGRGWCLAHYHRWRRYGDPVAAVPIQRRGLADLAASAKASR